MSTKNERVIQHALFQIYAFLLPSFRDFAETAILQALLNFLPFDPVEDVLHVKPKNGT